MILKELTDLTLMRKYCLKYKALALIFIKFNETYFNTVVSILLLFPYIGNNNP